MPNDKERIRSISLTQLDTSLLASPWIGIATDAWKMGRNILKGLTHEGLYEVLDYESTLELTDKTGKKAVLRKRKRVRYLQNNIITYQDYRWGDGQQFLDYQAKPGVAVDRYKIGYKTYIRSRYGR